MKGDEGDGSERETRQDKGRRQLTQTTEMTDRFTTTLYDSNRLRSVVKPGILFYFLPTCQTKTHRNIIVLS
jgi:hypothetical protein